jgi:hypothetical protein
VSTITQVDVAFRCACEGRVDVAAAVDTIGPGPHSVRSNAGRTEHEGSVTIQAGTVDEATTALRAAIQDAARAAGTTCEISIFGTRAVAGAPSPVPD